MKGKKAKQLKSHSTDGIEIPGEFPWEEKEMPTVWHQSWRVEGSSHRGGECTDGGMLMRSGECC